MARWRRLLSLAPLCLAAAGCSDVGTLTGADAPAATSHRWPETRVHRMADRCEGTALAPVLDGVDSGEQRRLLYVPYNPVPGGCAQIADRDSFSVVVNEVHAPREYEWFGDGRILPSDIAIVLDADLGGLSKAPEPIVVWFQKAYRSRSRLNLADLLVASRSSWNGRDVPRYRFRMVQVNDEVTKDLLKDLDGAGSIGVALATAAAQPLAIPLI